MERSGFLLALALCLSSADMCSVRVFVTISTLFAPKTFLKTGHTFESYNWQRNLAIHSTDRLHPLPSPTKETTFGTLQGNFKKPADNYINFLLGN